jgi:hypothetical protein
MPAAIRHVLHKIGQRSGAANTERRQARQRPRATAASDSASHTARAVPDGSAARPATFMSSSVLQATRELDPMTDASQRCLPRLAPHHDSLATSRKAKAHEHRGGTRAPGRGMPCYGCLQSATPARRHEALG